MGKKGGEATLPARSPRQEDLALCCQSRMAEGGIVPPHSVLAPGTALGSVHTVALSSAQARGIVGAQKWLSNRTKQKGAKIRPGCSIGVALGQLEIPPVGANSVRAMEAASASSGRGQQHVAWGGVALTVRNSHQIRPHLSCP